MNEESNSWGGPERDNTREDKEQPSSSSKGTSNEESATDHAQPHGKNDLPPNPPNYCFAADALAVVKKANDIAIALNHTERTMAHVIAGMALRADAASRFNKCRFNGGAMQIGVTSLSSERALQACLRFMQEKVKSNSEEQTADLPFSQEAHDVFIQAEALANTRTLELRKIEVGDILRAMTEGEVSGSLRPLLLGHTAPSLSDIAHELRRLEHSIIEVKTFNDGPSATNALNQLQIVLDAHLAKYDDVLSASGAGQSSTSGERTFTDHVRGVVTPSSTISSDPWPQLWRWFARAPMKIQESLIRLAGQSPRCGRPVPFCCSLPRCQRWRWRF